MNPCANPECGYWLIGGAAYCCGSCASAHERNYEIHESGPLGHTAGCARRGPNGSTTTEKRLARQLEQLRAELQRLITIGVQAANDIDTIPNLAADQLARTHRTYTRALRRALNQEAPDA